MSCNQQRLVTPCDEDAEEVFKPLEPNRDNPAGTTFGKGNLPGIILDYEIPTSQQEVFLSFQNLTCMDVNPNINQDIVEFIYSNLAEYGFINDSISFPPGEFARLQDTIGYEEGYGKVLSMIKESFDDQCSLIFSYNTPFNIYFQIYPVYLDKNFVTYMLAAYAYTGGAHGSQITYMKTYQLDDGKVLEFNDIVKPQNQSLVREEVAAHMAYSYPIYDNITTVAQYIDSLNVWLDNFDSEDTRDIITAKNFPVKDVALVERGLVFLYQMYELTPGSDGCPFVLIPYKDIKGCLFDRFNK